MKTYQLSHLVNLEQEQGQPIAALFNHGPINSNAELKGHFLLPLPAGEFPLQDTQKNIAAADKEAIDYALSIGLLRENDLFHQRIVELSPSGISTLFIPDIKLVDNKLTVYLMVFFFVLDDIVDDPKFRKQHDFTTIYEAVQCFSVALQGEALDENLLSQIKFPLIKPLCTFLVELRHQALQAASKKGLESIDPFIRSLSQWIAYASLNKHTQEEQNIPSETAYTLLRYIDIGAIPTFEALKLVKGICLPQQSTFLLEFLENLISAHCVLINDVVSIIKASEDDPYGFENGLYIKSNGLPIIQEAIDCTCQEANKLCQEISNTILGLKRLFSGHSELENYLESLARFAYGGILWYGREVGSTARYGKGIEYTFWVIKEDCQPGASIAQNPNALYTLPKPSVPLLHESTQTNTLTDVSQSQSHNLKTDTEDAVQNAQLCP